MGSNPTRGSKGSPLMGAAFCLGIRGLVVMEGWFYGGWGVDTGGVVSG